MIPKTLSAVKQHFNLQNITNGIRLNGGGVPSNPPRTETDPPRQAGEPRRSDDEFTGFIILRLSRHAEIPAAAEKMSLSEVAERNEYRALLQLIDEFDLKAAPFIEKVDRRKILEMEARAAESQFPPLRSLTSYRRLDPAISARSARSLWNA